MRNLIILFIVGLTSLNTWGQTQTVRLSNGGSTTVYYKKIGVVNSNSGELRVYGLLGAHTPLQGKSTLDITFSSRDEFVVHGQIDGRSSNSYVFLVQNGSGTFGKHYDVFLRYGAWAQVDFNVTATGHCSVYDSEVTTSSPGAIFWSSFDFAGDLSTSSFVGNLKVNGKIKAHEVEVTLANMYDLNLNGTLAANNITIKTNGQTADFVFKENYDLKDLSEVESYIKVNKCLPDIPNAETMEEQGVNLAEMNKLLLQKIEELTMYTIQQNEKLKEKDKQVMGLQSKIERFETLEERLTMIEEAIQKQAIR